MAIFRAMEIPTNRKFFNANCFPFVGISTVRCFYVLAKHSTDINKSQHVQGLFSHYVYFHANPKKNIMSLYEKLMPWKSGYYTQGFH